MHRKKLIRTLAMSTALCLMFTTGALASILGELIDGHDTYL